MKKSVLGWFSAAIVAAFVFSSHAAEPVTYLDWDPVQKKMVEKTCTEYTVVTAETSTFTTGGWYVVSAIVSRNSIKVAGAVHLVLCDGAVLNVGRSGDGHCLRLPGESALTIYGQTAGTGTLDVIGGIGGDNYKSSSDLTINGGTVIAKAESRDAAIGGGFWCSGGDVTINGGTVTATSTSSGAAIGGGYAAKGGTVTINGGTVTAVSLETGSGIGGGEHGSKTYVTINGGTVTATSRSGAGIGSGEKGDSTCVLIAGGRVSAIGYVDPENGDLALGFPVIDLTFVVGGLFSMPVEKPSWLAPGFVCVENTDPETKDAYGWKVVPGAVKIVSSEVCASGDGKRVFRVGVENDEYAHYDLKRGTDLRVPVSEWETVASVPTEAAGTAFLEDPNPPEDCAFYTVEPVLDLLDWNW